LIVVVRQEGKPSVFGCAALQVEANAQKLKINTLSGHDLT